jgi:hypothetical protein
MHTMSVRGIQVTGRRRLVAIALSVAVVLAVASVSGALLFNSRTAHGSGTGGGGCFATTDTAPACTFRDNNAFAFFNNFSSDSCIITSAVISVFDNLTTPGHTASSTAFVSIDTYDVCNNELLSQIGNYDPITGQTFFTGTIQLGSELSGARVTGTAAMYDLYSYSPNPLFTTTIDLIFKGYGSTSRFSDIQHAHSAGFIMNSRYTGTSRPAAVSGTFTDEAGSNIAAAQSAYAELINSTGGTVQIIRQ